MYTESRGRNVRDPKKHAPDFLEAFIADFEAGIQGESLPVSRRRGEGGGG